MHHERVSLEMEVAKHFVGAPAAYEFDDVGINLAAQKCHGTASTQCSCGDVAGKDAKVRQGRGSAAQGGGEY